MCCYDCCCVLRADSVICVAKLIAVSSMVPDYPWRIEKFGSTREDSKAVLVSIRRSKTYKTQYTCAHVHAASDKLIVFRCITKALLSLDNNKHDSIPFFGNKIHDLGCDKNLG